MTEGDSRMIEVAGHDIHLWEAGQGPTVILLHGAGGNLRDFTFHLAPALAARYRVIAFDRPGLGLSQSLGRGRESPAEQAEILSRAATRLGVTQAVIVGHSYGGAVAMAWALNHADQAAAIVSLAGATHPWDGGLGAYYAMTGSRLGGLTIVPLIANLVPRRMAQNTIECIFAPDPVPKGYGGFIRPELTLQSPVLRANGRQVMELLPHVAAMSLRYPDLDLPVEIVHGRADTTVPLTTHSTPLAARVKGANLTILEDAGHMPHHADPEATIAAIDRAADRAGLR
ncbi:alpha/beta hydrolase [Rhodophyticola sp. CCM32]|uniref:alpha/beta fold hydrolase n=1 Tax=Rhodophyticola sp. CCM32 TaxID=2916397 RepID=UPI00107F6972|nr:alpha/beta hydrolase [Rhodophyticola sp. CCM32]QBY00344.1 alpha/beta hydrolase [Rhodophyticola sp. CCM32]